MTRRPPTRPVTGPRHATRLRRHPLVHAAYVALVGLVTFVVSAGAFTYGTLQGNITAHDITDLVGRGRPDAEEPADPRAGKPLNVLLMGSDVRTGENAVIGGEVEGMRSDTTLLVHIAADRTRADIVSIPRDLLVDIPPCALPDGTTSPEQPRTMFNEAFATGGQDGQVEYAAACAIRTVEDMTGVFIDDFMVIDFAGFTFMVDALGGIPMCIPEPMTDRLAGLDLEAGQQVLDGRQALAYARARKDVGDGSDISRIGRQQLLLGAMIRQVLSKNLLTDLPALYQFLDAATRSVTAGPTLGRIPNLVGLATSFRSVPAGGVTFVTVPFEWAGPRVRPTEEAEILWAAIAADEPIAPPPAATPTDDPTEPAGPAPTAPEPPTSPTPTPTPTTQPWDFITGEDPGGVCG